MFNTFSAQRIHLNQSVGEIIAMMVQLFCTFLRLKKILALGAFSVSLASCASPQYPEQAGIHLSAAELFFSSNDRARAREALNAVAMQNPYSASLQLQVAEIFFRYDDLESARTHFEAASSLGDSNGANLGLARISLRGNSIEDADRLFNQVLQKSPSNADALNGLGVTYDMRLHHENAQSLYRQALSYAPNHVGARNNLALSMALNGQAAEAQSMQTQLYLSYTDNKLVRHTLSLIQAANSDEVQAKKTAAMDLDEEQTVQNIVVMRHFQTGRSGLLTQGPNSYPERPVLK